MTSSSFNEILTWCASVLGPVELLSDQSREHPGLRAGAYRLRTKDGSCYVKLHRDPAHWESEFHAYEQWAPAFGRFAPRLLAARSEPPLALIIGELPGMVLEGVQLSPTQERAVWCAAGRALAGFHAQAVGEAFGPCRRDGSPAGTPVTDAEEYVRAGFDDWLARGLRGGWLSDEEHALVQAARERIPAFAGERPVPCHRDYCPANWLVGEGAWTGVIDFEFSAWDVRVADFTRSPTWEWLNRPDLEAAFFEGYGRVFTPEEEQQRLVGHVLYALGAIVWGKENEYNGFAREGRQALRQLAPRLR